MGRKRKVPQGIELPHWRDSDDDSSEPVRNPIPKVRITTTSLLRQDLSPTPSLAPSTISSPGTCTEIETSDSDFLIDRNTKNYVPLGNDPERVLDRQQSEESSNDSLEEGGGGGHDERPQFPRRRKSKESSIDSLEEEGGGGGHDERPQFPRRRKSKDCLLYTSPSPRDS